MKEFLITSPSLKIRDRIVSRIDNLNKPKGSLGLLETIAAQICLIQQTLKPEIKVPCHLLFGGDHGIEREGVSVSPREVTWQQMINFTLGGGGVNMFCRQHGFRLFVIDVGTDHDLSDVQGIIDRKIACGTADFLYGPAMTVEQFDRAIDVGCEMVGRCRDIGSNLLCIGEMGIGNTSPSSVWTSLLGGVPLTECIGAGAGLDNAGVSHKQAVLSEAVIRFNATQPAANDVETIIRYFGGFEMVSAVGAMLRAAELGFIILIDGFIMTACALAASKLCPAVTDYMVFGHQGDESGHSRLLRLLHAHPLLSIGMRLGEGTGALCSFPLVDSAVRMMNEMSDFDNANITRYF